jgi:hypothetical protein
MIESGRSRESAAPFIDEMGRLLRVMTTSLENAADPAAMIPEIVTRLHRTVPSLMVRIVDASQAALIRNDAVYFRVPTEGIETLIVWWWSFREIAHSKRGTSSCSKPAPSCLRSAKISPYHADARRRGLLFRAMTKWTHRNRVVGTSWSSTISMGGS